MRIERLAAKPDRAGRYLVQFEGGQTMRLYRQTVEDFALCPGEELDEERMGQLREAAGQMSAKMRAVRIVTASSVTKDDLRQRLIQKGEAPRQAEEAVAWMAELSLVDDRQTARQIVDRCAARGYGLARAKQALYEKQVPKALWAEVLADYPDQSPAIEAFLAQRLGPDAGEKDRKRAVDALLRRGHSYGQIRQALEKIDLQGYPEGYDG